MLTILAVVAVLAAGADRADFVRESLTGTHVQHREGLQNVRRVVREERPLEPVAYDYDARTGALLRVIPLYFTAKPARIFDPNPVASLNDMSLRDRNDAAEAVPEAAYRTVEVGDVLANEFVQLVDLQDPRIAPPTGTFNRADDGFEDVNAFVHITRVQSYLHSLGYAGPRTIAPYAIPVDAHAVNGTDNSYYLPSPTNPGFGALYFGEGGTDDAEDADLVVHEYGHALLDWIAPSTFNGTYVSQARALGEAFCDYLAFSQHYETRVASGRDPFCFADWDARCAGDAASENCGYPEGADCLRRLDSARTMADYENLDAPGTEHRNGQIWSSALRELFLVLGKRTTDILAIEAMFGAPANPSFGTIARQMIAADRALYAGAHVQAICGVMSARGIFTGDCDPRPHGEFTFVQSPQRELAIPEADPNGVVTTLTIDDPRTIEALRVRVDLRHTSRGDLRITLIAPDGTEVILLQPTLDRAPDLHTTFGRDVEPVQSLDVLRGRVAAGTWKLRVADVRTRDVGMLESWGLDIQFAGDAPLLARPMTDAKRQTLPVVAHLRGVDATEFLSDVRIVNPSAASRNVTLIFTPSGADGTTTFFAQKLIVASRETIVIADVVRSLFATSGSGSIEVQGEVLVTSRTYTRLANGATVGQHVPPVVDTAGPLFSPLLISGIPDPGMRFNVGVVEVGGGRGTVLVASTSSGDKRITIEPYSHLQLPVGGGEWVIVWSREGSARIAAYGSFVDPATGDTMFVPAVGVHPLARELVAPAIRGTGANGFELRTDISFGILAYPLQTFPLAFGDTAVQVVPHEQAAAIVLRDVLATSFHLTNAIGVLDAQLPDGVAGGARISGGGIHQFVPLLPVSEASEQQLIAVENNDAFRTNIGFVTNTEASAEVTVLNAAGEEVERFTLVSEHGLAQRRVGVPVTGGRAIVRILSGRATAYSSVIDNRSGDAMFVPAQ